MRHAFFGGIAALLVLFFAIPIAFAPGDNPASSPSAAAGDIPAAALAAYLRWGDTCPGLQWAVLAGIGKVESGHGSTGGASIQPDGETLPYILGPPLDGSGAGGNTTAIPAGRWAGMWGLSGPWQQALGPMQFLPGTFEEWAVDGNGDGRVDPHNINDAVASAAAYLCGPEHRIDDERAAIRRYNNSDAYADEVLRWAATYSASSGALLVGGVPSPTDVLSNPNVDVYPGGRNDIASGLVDGRILQVLMAIGAQHRITATALITGHSRCIDDQPDVPGCVVSNHYSGRAVDIAIIDDIAVSASNPVAVEVMHELAALPSSSRPDEIGGPVDTGEPGVFTDSFHTDHIHVGYRS
jgi:hypothetical protein